MHLTIQTNSSNKRKAFNQTSQTENAFNTANCLNIRKGIQQFTLFKSH